MALADAAGSGCEIQRVLRPRSGIPGTSDGASALRLQSARIEIRLSMARSATPNGKASAGSGERKSLEPPQTTNRPPNKRSERGPRCRVACAHAGHIVALVFGVPLSRRLPMPVVAPPTAKSAKRGVQNVRKIFLTATTPSRKRPSKYGAGGCPVAAKRFPLSDRLSP